jgi:hypothetical protein
MYDFLIQYTECFKNRTVLIQLRKCDFVNCLKKETEKSVLHLYVQK